MISTKPFPWKCDRCNQRTVQLGIAPYSLEIEYEGRILAIHIPDLETPRCEHCGEPVLDDAANLRISREIRLQLGLLTPEQIRLNRESIGQTQDQLASHLGLPIATLTCWESGHQIQQRAMDRLLRLYFASPEARFVLSNESKLHEPEQVAEIE